ncbi:MAG: hypothetical protein KJ057_13075 [Phycisphaerae bacterium]|nr:hypothetical protein [Planctomycetia bacterium]MCL4719397.1 hypothetical protein [Phycisphaerae bacterium]
MSPVVAEGRDGRIRTRSKIHFTRARRGRKELHRGEAPPAPPPPIFGRVPHIARLMALAIRMQRLVDLGQVHDYAELARLGRVTRARVTQIMNLLSLAPDIQEDILFLPPIEAGRDPIKEWQIRPITLVPDWRKQRRQWQELRSRATPPVAGSPEAGPKI